MWFGKLYVPTERFFQTQYLITAILIGIVPDTILDPNPYAPIRNPVIENNNGVPTFTDFSKINQRLNYDQ